MRYTDRMTTRAKLPLLTAATASGLAVVLIGGCEVRVPSPRNPQVEVPASVALMQTEQLARESEAKALQADREFKVAVQKVEASSQVSLAELAAAHDRAVDSARSEAAAVRETVASAIKAAEDRQQAWIAPLTIASGVAQQSGIPGVASIGGVLAGVLGVASAYRAKSKATTAEQTAAAEASLRKEQEAIAARIVDSLDILKHLSPEVAAAFKAHGSTLAEWQGPDAVNFINKVQNG